MYCNMYRTFIIFYNCIICCTCFFSLPDFYTAYQTSLAYLGSCGIKSSSEVYRGLMQNVSSNLYGQPFLVQGVLKPIYNHLEDDDPPKALVFSFQGPPGVGKNFLSSMIGHHMFYFGTSSNYFVLRNGRTEYSNKNRQYEYISTMVQDVMSAVRRCPRSIFVFDEIDFVPDGLFNVLAAFLEPYEQYRNVDFRKSIFIFISNIGSKIITDLAYDRKKQGFPRESFSLNHFREKLQTENYNSEGGFRSSNLIANHLVDYFIPFLPLEKEHVSSCINYYARKRNITVSKQLHEYIFANMSFIPAQDPTFSSSGCKGIVSLMLVYSRSTKQLSEGKDEL